jgi:hypothetical protein
LSTCGERLPSRFARRRGAVLAEAPAAPAAPAGALRGSRKAARQRTPHEAPSAGPQKQRKRENPELRRANCAPYGAALRARTRQNWRQRCQLGAPRPPRPSAAAPLRRGALCERKRGSWAAARGTRRSTQCWRLPSAELGARTGGDD